MANFRLRRVAYVSPSGLPAHRPPSAHPPPLYASPSHSPTIRPRIHVPAPPSSHRPRHERDPVPPSTAHPGRVRVPALPSNHRPRHERVPSEPPPGVRTFTLVINPQPIPVLTETHQARA